MVPVQSTIPLPIPIPRKDLERLCRNHHVVSLSLFGSALTDRFGPESDLDFLVTFQGVPLETYADNFFDFRDALASLFGRKVDLVEEKTLRNPYFIEVVEKSKVLVYG
jgi:hypothetical protein